VTGYPVVMDKKAENPKDYGYYVTIQVRRGSGVAWPDVLHKLTKPRPPSTHEAPSHRMNHTRILARAVLPRG